jgi:hypothetical protein
MNLKAGDKVRFLDEKGQGTISRFIDNRQALVQMEDGFEIPYLIAKLVPAEIPPKLQSTLKTQEEVKATPHCEAVSSGEQGLQLQGVYLVYLPLDPDFILGGNFRLMVFNMTSLHIQFSISSRHLGKFTCEFAGTLSPRQSCQIREIKSPDLERWSTLHIEVSFFNYDLFLPITPISRLLKQKAAKFFKESSFATVGLTSQPSITVDLTRTMQKGQEEEYFEETDLNRILQEKQYRPVKQYSLQSEKNSALEWEVDLHAEELDGNLRGMSNGHIIDMQLRHFQKKLDEAMAGNVRKVVFIHGVGNGRLKQEIRKILATHAGLQFHDASYSSYGFGATEVQFR